MSPTSKDALRRRIILARKSAGRDVQEESRLRDRAREAFAGVIGPGSSVALYVSIEDEPPTRGLIDDLAASGARVLLPVLRKKPDWGWFDGWDRLAPGWRGIPEPPEDARLSRAALSMADLVICPGLAVGRDGARLGVGGGWYDTALPSRRPGTPVWCLVRPSEVLDTVPTEPHDVRVDAALTSEGLVVLGGAGSF